MVLEVVVWYYPHLPPCMLRGVVTGERAHGCGQLPSIKGQVGFVGVGGGMKGGGVKGSGLVLPPPSIRSVG